MNKATVVGRNTHARIGYVPRPLSALIQKVRPARTTEPSSPTTNPNTFHLDSLPSVTLPHYAANQLPLRNTDDGHYKSKIEGLPSPAIHKSSSFSTDDLSNLRQIKDSNHGFSSWFSRLTSKQKIAFKVIIASLIILAIAAAVVLPVYFFVINQTHLESSFTNYTDSVCSSTTCIGRETPYRTSIVTALYAFDGNMNDQSSYATGTAYGSSIPLATAAGYVSQALTLSSSALQYVQIPNINFAKQSFTLQTWINPTTPGTANDYGIFSQCDSNMICLSVSLRSARITLSLDSMNTSSSPLIGATVINSNWYHITVVYHATLFQQKIYVNGRIDAISYGIVSPYQGVSSSATTNIGRGSSFAYGTTYFNGRIDHFTISAGTVRTTCQILNDASLVVYFPFDTTATLNDRSVNICNGISSGTTTISTGRVNQAISFTSTSSYFQAQCFPKMRSNNDQAYSFSLWINPNSTIGSGSIMHMSATTNGTAFCYDALTFTGNGSLVFQWMITAVNVASAQGPVISANTWTHVAVVFGVINGIRLYINGQFFTSSPNTANLYLFDTAFTIYPMYITLGNTGLLGPSGSVSCTNGSIPISSGSFSGAIDEFRFYNRELDNQEICVLANP